MNMRTGKKSVLGALMLSLLLVSSARAQTYQDGVYRDVAEGYNGDVIVTVTVRGGKIDSLTAENKEGEESEYFLKARDGLSERIIAAQGIEGVEAVSGATGTSESILSAMEGVLKQAMYTGAAGDANGAGGGMSNGSMNGTGDGMGDGASGGMDGGSMNGTGGAGDGMGSGSINGAGDGANGGGTGDASAPAPTTDPATAERTLGLGSAANFRVGPGKDADGNPVYSFNVAMAAVFFDKEGRILGADVDIYEIATPNYEGETMPHFTGWPGMTGARVYDHETGALSDPQAATEESLAEEVAAWQTKRERGDSYGMNPQNDWYRQMDFYERWMVGKTPNELRSWYARYTSERNGKPLTPNSTDAADQKAYNALSEQEKADLADVTASATMSLSDGHGLILEAIEKAYDNRQAVEE